MIGVNGGTLSVSAQYSSPPIIAFQNMTRNDIEALGFEDFKKRIPNYYVDIPRGLFCSYSDDSNLRQITIPNLMEKSPDGRTRLASIQTKVDLVPPSFIEVESLHKPTTVSFDVDSFVTLNVLNNEADHVGNIMKDMILGKERCATTRLINSCSGFSGI